MNSPFRVSILICAHNEEKNIAALLVSLAHQTALTNIKEVILADNKSTDKTVSLAQEMAQTYQLPLRVLSLGENNIGKARRALVEAATETLVAFVDGDCKVEPSWLQTLLSHFLNVSKFDSRLAGVGGPNRTSGKNFFQKTLNANLDRGWLHGFSSQSFQTKKLAGISVDHLPTTNALFLKSALVSVGNFSASFARVGEDLDLGLRLTQNRYQLRSFPTPVVINDCAETLGEWAQRMFRFGVAQGLTLGRRLSFVTLTLLVGTLWAGWLLAYPNALTAQASLILFSIVVLISRAVPQRHFQSRKMVQSTLSFFYAPVIYGTTAFFYFCGFYWGALKRIEGLYKN